MVKLFRNKKSQLGQTIVEVLIAAGVVGVVLTGIAAGLSYSIKNSSDARYRAFATTYAQDAIEVFRREKTLLGWEAFYDSLATGVYCANDLPENTTEFLALQPGTCTAGVATFGVEFTRTVDIVVVSPTEIQVTSVVNWTDATRTPEVRVVQQLRPY